MPNPAKEGRQAFQRGASIFANPYTWPNVSKQAEQWEAGFIAEREALRQAQENALTADYTAHMRRKGYA